MGFPSADIESTEEVSNYVQRDQAIRFTNLERFLAILGAVITVAAMAVDPFSQQIIHYQSCYEPLSNVVARVPVTNNYTQGGAQVWVGESTLDNKMIAAVYQGFFNPPDNASAIIPFECPTGNCAFTEDNGATYSSLGMCYSYLDINDTIVHSSNYTWSLPSGITIGEAVTLATGWVTDNHGALLSFDTIMIQTYQNGSHYRPYAFRSSIFPCVRTYSADISNFILDERILSTIPLTYLEEGGDFLLVTNQTLRKGKWNECNPTPIPTADNPVAFPFSSETELPKNTTIQYFAADCVWSFQFYAIMSFAPNVGALFDRQNLSSSYGLPFNAQGPDYLLNLAANGSADSTTVSNFLGGLSNTITANMRQRGQTTPEGYATGTVKASYICVQVVWPWLSLPALLLLLTIGFISLVILQPTSLSGDLPVWKSSELTLLFHGFDDDSLRKYPTLQDEHDIKAFSTDVRALLVKDEQRGWRFMPVAGD